MALGRKCRKAKNFMAELSRFLATFGSKLKALQDLLAEDVNHVSRKHQPCAAADPCQLLYRDRAWEKGQPT